MATKARPRAKAIMPVKVRRVTSHLPCESCHVKSVRYEARFNPPGTERVSFRLCGNCIEAIRQG